MERIFFSEQIVETESAIGIFDSGIGGLTVYKEIVRLTSSENLIYLGDTARCPYGTKSNDVVTQYACENSEFLVERNVKMLVVACNTVSAVALSTLKKRFDIPIIGVIDPGATAAVRATNNGKIGVIGTDSTIASGAYTQAIRRIDASVEIYTRACPLFVPLVEEGWTDNEVTRSTVAMYLNSLKQSGIDTMILGCTHYPLLKSAIHAYMGTGVTLIDSAEETARSVIAALPSREHSTIVEAGRVSFFVTDSPDRFIRVGSRFIGDVVQSAVRLHR